MIPWVRLRRDAVFFGHVSDADVKRVRWRVVLSDMIGSDKVLKRAIENVMDEKWKVIVERYWVRRKEIERRKMDETFGRSCCFR